MKSNAFYAIFCLLLSGCLAAPGPAGPPSSMEPKRLNGDDSGTEPYGALGSTTNAPLRLNVGTLVPLAGPFASEPVVSVANGGTVVVVAPSGKANPTIVTNGGVAWTSRDHGETFRLVLDPASPASPAASCSCDADIDFDGDTFFLTSMYRTVNPFFNANLATSKDGLTWTTEQMRVADAQPIDRPWVLKATPSDLLYLVYRTDVSTLDLPGPEVPVMDRPKPGTILLTSSSDGGKTWNSSTPVAVPGDGEGLIPLKPRLVEPSAIAVPLLFRTATDQERERGEVAISIDGGRSFTRQPINDFHEYYATFDMSLDAWSETAVAAWTEADSTGTQKIWLRQGRPAQGQWSPPRALQINGSALQPWVALGDGKMAIAFYGTGAEGPILEMGEDVGWYPMLAVVLNGKLATAKLSPEPTFFGPLCNLAPRCPPENAVSPMREFLSTEWDGNRVVVAFTDARDRPDEQDPLATPKGRITVVTVDVETSAD